MRSVIAATVRGACYLRSGRRLPGCSCYPRSKLRVQVATQPQRAPVAEYKSPSLATDAIVLRNHKNDQYHDILLVTRRYAPHKDKLAFPGGFVDYGEDPSHGCLRELEEECGIKGRDPELVTVAGNPLRDPREHVVSICYRVYVDDTVEARAGDDAATARFLPLQPLLKLHTHFAFDHYDILRSYILKTYPHYAPSSAI